MQQIPEIESIFNLPRLDEKCLKHYRIMLKRLHQGIYLKYID